jgi:2-oxoglutarate dehydrogenase complex dehydrogenase (E1) component-like enzyme
MYARVKAHPGVRHLYAQKLIRENSSPRQTSRRMTERVVEKYEGICGAPSKSPTENRNANFCPPRRRKKTARRFWKREFQRKL